MIASTDPIPAKAPRRFPLIARVIGWLILNLMMLAGVAFLAAQHYFGNGYEALLAGGAADRVKSLTRLILQEMQSQPRSNWDGTLERFGAAYNIKVYAFSDSGLQLAGTQIELPSEVQQRLVKDQRRPPGGRDRRPGPRPGEPPGPGPGPEGQMRPEEDGRLFDGPPPDDLRPGPEDDEALRPPPPPPPRSGGGEPRPAMIHGFMHAGEPAAWWLLTRVDLQPPIPNGPLTLVMASDTLSAGGLLVDFGPGLRIAGVALALSVLFWIPLVRGITHTIGKLRDATSQIAIGQFDVRVNDKRGDELGELGASINTMTERLAGLMNGQRRFLSDVAHELCAPLSRLQMALGILEERARNRQTETPEQMQLRLTDLREEVDHMANLVNELLSFSRAALGNNQKQLFTIELLPVLEAAAKRETLDGSDVSVACPTELRAIADPDLLARAVGNLVRNAIRYAGQAGPVEVTARPKNDGVELLVVDRGPGVPPDSLPQLFDPFYRVDTSRTRDTGGVGLGLTIAKTCVEACGGNIRAINRAIGGFEVVIWLPS